MEVQPSTSASCGNGSESTGSTGHSTREPLLLVLEPTESLPPSKDVCILYHAVKLHTANMRDLKLGDRYEVMKAMVEKGCPVRGLPQSERNIEWHYAPLVDAEYSDWRNEILCQYCAHSIICELWKGGHWFKPPPPEIQLSKLRKAIQPLTEHFPVAHAGLAIKEQRGVVWVNLARLFARFEQQTPHPLKGFVALALESAAARSRMGEFALALCMQQASS
jgi:hypothetical protein